jgi:biopolymer transport protein ExbB/TolQ
MKLLKFKLIVKKIWLFSKKFWWALVLGLGLIIVGLLYLMTRNGAYTAGLLDLLEAKRDAHDQEMETLAHIHNTELAEKKAKLEEHLKRRDDLERKFKERGEKLSKEKEATLKRLVDESYNDPEKLSREIAITFGIEHG